ncbi:GntR family transcriptional regulator [Acuticoccus sp. I52.16.1]|uniref:GntR family transcriptional regulator n=1 Tax=Acuticoccus sp. I52.16.1 TaxID=2928472 RepID=UPI001FD27245|nr:GntR family transcriptional regulator [Acuticoccus sp. I52.16.1]UOM33106.1 GntR family transcriptional regulator [Acuticoccus sp. I52.16.1]
MKTGENTSKKGLTQAAYGIIREAIMSGGFEPGQKLSTRKIAVSIDIGITPVREALVRLVAERALEANLQRSPRIPLLTRARARELIELRSLLEGRAAEYAAAEASAEEIAALQRISLEIMAAREQNDRARDIRKIYEFHFTLYRCARRTELIGLIETLWLRTGPYLNLLFPDYTRTQFGEGRGRIIAALRARDGASARREIEDDISGALTFIIDHVLTED